MSVIWNQFLWQKTHKNILSLASGELGYTTHNQYLIFCANPTVIEPHHFWSEFKTWLSQHNFIGCGYYLTQSELQRSGLLSQQDFLYQQVGVRRLYEAKAADLKGSEFEEVRRALIKGDERGLSFKVLSLEEKHSEFSLIQNLYEEWKESKGALDLEFFISPMQMGPHVEAEKWVGVYKEAQLVAFVSLIPVGSESYYVDQMFFSKEQAKWSMNFLFAKLIETLPVGGSLDLGLCPLASIQSNYLLQKASAATEYLPLSYNFHGLYEFKKKFSNQEEACYAILSKKHSQLKQYKAMLEASVNRLRYLVSF